jgi:hypothetical protein
MELPRWQAAILSGSRLAPLNTEPPGPTGAIVSLQPSIFNGLKQQDATIPTEADGLRWIEPPLTFRAHRCIIHKGRTAARVKAMAAQYCEYLSPGHSLRLSVAALVTGSHCASGTALPMGANRPPPGGVECRLGSSIIKTASPKKKPLHCLSVGRCHRRCCAARRGH